MTKFTTLSAGGGITVGSDGNLYFTFNNQVGQEVLTGGSPTTFNRLPNPNGGTLTAQKQDITTGSDGNIWYTQQSPAAIVQLLIAPPTFRGLSAPTPTYGTPSTTLSGQIAAGTVIPTGDVSITLDGVTQSAAIDQTTGDFSSTFTTATLGVTDLPYTITYAYAGSASFNPASTTRTLTVKPAPLTITANDTSKTFGQAADFAATAFTTSGLLNGDALASVTETSTGSVATTAVGTYAIVPSSATFSTGASTNYTITYDNGTLTVNQATPTVTWAQPADIAFGTALGSAQLDATASVAGTYSYSPLAGTLLSLGQGQTLMVTFTPTDATDYTTATCSTVINVQPVTTFSGLSAPTITYGTSSTTLSGQIAAGTAIPTGNVSITLDGVTQSPAIDSSTGDFSSTFDTSTLGVAGSPYTITYAYAGSTNFNHASTTTTLTVNPAALTITASDASMTFGQAADFAATAFTTSGLLNDDAVASVTETSTGSAATAAVGTYPIVPSSATFSTGASTNYTITYANGALTVNQATPTITWANPADIVYGTALSNTQLDATASFAGNAVAGTFMYSLTPGTVLDAGQSEALSVSFVPEDSADFSGATASVQINVTPAPLTVTVSNASKVYDQPNPAFTVLYSSFVNGDTASNLGGSLRFSTAATLASDVGSYDVTASGLTASNYAIVYAKGTLGVTPADQPITWANPADIIYGTPLGTGQLNATVSGVGPAPAGTLSYTPALGTILQAGTDQTLTVIVAATQDYKTATATATINVLKATPTVSWAMPGDITSGTALSDAQLDAIASVPGTFNYTPAAGAVLASGEGQTLTVTLIPTDSTDYASAAGSTTINVLTPPQVSTIAPTSSKKGLTSFTVSYNEPLNSSSAGSSALYHVFAAVTKIVKKHKETLFTKPLAISGVSHNSSGSTVTINLAKPYKGQVQVTVQGIITAANGASKSVNFPEILK